MPFPTDKASRTTTRAEILAGYIAEAERRHLIANRSIKCGGGNLAAEPKHAGMFDGCRNDGTSCLCECHDH